MIRRIEREFINPNRITIPDDFMEEGEAGVSVLDDDGAGGEGGDEVGDGGEVRHEVDADGEGDEEEAAEEEHLVAAEVIAGHPHRDEEDDARRDGAELDGTDHLVRLRPSDRIERGLEGGMVWRSERERRRNRGIRVRVLGIWGFWVLGMEGRGDSDGATIQVSLAT